MKVEREHRRSLLMAFLLFASVNRQVSAFSSSNFARRGTCIAPLAATDMEQDQFNLTVASHDQMFFKDEVQEQQAILTDLEIVETMSDQMNNFFSIEEDAEAGATAIIDDIIYNAELDDDDEEDPFLKQLEETLLATIQVLEDTLQESQIVNELETMELKEQQSILEHDLAEQKSMTEQALAQLQMERFLMERMQVSSTTSEATIDSEVPPQGISDNGVAMLLQVQQQQHLQQMKNMELALHKEQEERKKAEAARAQLEAVAAAAASIEEDVKQDGSALQAKMQQQQQLLELANQKVKQLDQDLSASKTELETKKSNAKSQQAIASKREQELQDAVAKLEHEKKTIDLVNAKTQTSLAQLESTQDQLQTAAQKAQEERTEAKQTAASTRQELTKTKRSLAESMANVGRLETQLVKIQKQQQQKKDREKQQQQQLKEKLEQQREQQLQQQLQEKKRALTAQKTSYQSSSSGGGKKDTPTPKPSIVSPRLDNWELTPAGEVQGSVCNHPSLPNGEPIRTSLLVNPKLARDGATVKTRSGSSYKLGKAKRTPEELVAPKPKPGMNLFGGSAAGMPSKQESQEEEETKENMTTPSFNLFGSSKKKEESEKKEAEDTEPSSQAQSAKTPLSTPLLRMNFFGSSSAPKKDTEDDVPEGTPETTPKRQPYGGLNIFGNSISKGKKLVEEDEERAEVEESGSPVSSYSSKAKPKGLKAVKAETQKLDLTGKSFCNGKYLLAGKAKKSVTGRCLILGAYQANGDSNPSGKPLIIKLSENGKAMKKEHSIYKKVASGVNRGVIVKCHGYVPEVEERPGKSALILERGVRDLKEHRRWHGLNGDALKEALYSVNQCMESFHGARLVWTDMKTENFVIVEDETSGEHSVKAIDLESAMNVKENPIDYTPEATPPEFAKAFVSGDPHSFVLDFSFDVWSFGMLAYELATGVGYFDGNSPDAIMQKLSQNNVPNTSIGIEDDDLADLISQSLSLDPKKRPSAQKISRHPYFSSVSKPALFQLW